MPGTQSRESQPASNVREASHPIIAALNAVTPRKNTPHVSGEAATTALISGGGGPAPHPRQRGENKNSRLCTIDRKLLAHPNQDKEPPQPIQNKKGGVRHKQNAQVMTSVVSPSWVAEHTRPTDHASSAANLVMQMPDANARNLKKEKSIFAAPIPIHNRPLQQWPMESTEPSPIPPPWPSRQGRAAIMFSESAATDPEQPLGPLTTKWVNSLVSWYEKLQTHFGFDESNLFAANVTSKAHKWES